MNIPTIEEIKEDYNKIVPIFKGVRDVKTLRNLAKEHGLHLEFDGLELERYDGSEDDIAEFVRINNYGTISYLYFWYIKDGFINILFDVWCEELNDTFIADTTIDTLEAKYKEALGSLENG